MKKYYYVGVLEDRKLCMVTSINNTERNAYWEDDKKPYSMPLPMAKDIQQGLLLNGFVAVVIQSSLELLCQFHKANK